MASIDSFTTNAKHAMNMARREAQRLNHQYLGTEHLLLGVLDAERCTARVLLQRMGFRAEQVRAEVARIVKSGPTLDLMGTFPFTPGAKKALELAMEATEEFEDSDLGTEHLLIGLAREKEGFAAQALANMGVSVDRARANLYRLRFEQEAEHGPRKKPVPVERQTVFERLRSGIKLLRQLGEFAAADRIEAIVKELQEKKE